MSPPPFVAEDLAARLAAVRGAPEVWVTAVRHGETTLNAAGLLTGRLDAPLTDRGRAQAAALAPLVGSAAWDARIHSGAQRTRDTFLLAHRAAGVAVAGAELADDDVPLRRAAGHAPSPFEVEPRLLERCYGRLEGAPWGTWTQPDDVDAAPPDGESYRQLGLRVLDVVADLMARAAAEQRPLRMLLFAHSGVLRALGGIAAQAPELTALLGPGPKTAEAIELRYADIAVPGFLSARS